jgi:hypothetical protein
VWQFLALNPEMFPSGIFGMSAQGGDLDDPAAVSVLAAIDPPAERVRVRWQGHTTNDLSLPLRWMLE